VNRKHCGKQLDHEPHSWWGREFAGPKTAYWCTGSPPVVEGGRFGLRPRGTLTVTPPEDRR
jgi:hypothetical protein